MRALALAVLAAAFASQALAATPVTLRSDVSDSDGRVTLGDLFEGAGAAADTGVAIRNGSNVVLDAGQVQIAARRAGLEWSNAQGLRRIVVRAGSDGSATAPAVAAKGGVEVLTWARSMNANEVVQASDLTWTKLAGAPTGAALDSDMLVGMSVRRPLREGAAAYSRDVSAPLVIKAGDMVEVRYANEGISLTLQAKAMGPATVGQPFAVQNLQSKKIIEAVAQGPGLAVVGPEAARARAPAQYAAR
jgi:flagella basal body P-ring formation protein FlgA